MKLHTEITIAGAHQLPAYAGPCSKIHGHSWLVVVEAEGEPNPETGWMVNFSDIKKEVNKLDHQTLNDFVEVPTAENIVDYLLEKLRLLNPKLAWYVRVHEAATSWISKGDNKNTHDH